MSVKFVFKRNNETIIISDTKHSDILCLPDSSIMILDNGLICGISESNNSGFYFLDYMKDINDRFKGVLNKSFIVKNIVNHLQKYINKEPLWTEHPLYSLGCLYIIYGSSIFVILEDYSVVEINSYFCGDKKGATMYSVLKELYNTEVSNDYIINKLIFFLSKY